MKKLLLIIIGLIFMVNNLTAQTFTVNPGNHSSWFDNASWVGGVSPGDMIYPGQTVIIPSGSSINYDSFQLIIIGTLQIDGTMSLPTTEATSLPLIVGAITVFGTMNITGSLAYSQFASGHIMNRIVNIGTVNIDGGTITRSQFLFDAIFFINTESGELNIINGGRLVADEKFINYQIINEGFIDNQGQIGRIHNFENMGTFINAGSLSVRPSSSPAVGLTEQGIATFSNSGSFTNSGALNFDSFDASPQAYESSITATNTGTFINNAGASILMRPRQVDIFNPVTFTNAPGSSFTNNGVLTITFNGATFENNTNAFTNTNAGSILLQDNALLNTTRVFTNEGTITNNATMSVVGFGILDNEVNGTVINNSSFINNGTLNSVGVFTNNGTLTNDDVPSVPTASGRMNINGIDFTNNGTIVNDFIIENNGTINNNPMATITNNSFLINDGDIINQGNIEVLNDGIIIRTSPTGVSNIENSGSIMINNASFNLRRTVLNNTGSILLTGISETGAGRLFIEQASFSRLTNQPEGNITIDTFGALSVNFGILQNLGGTIDINAGGELLIRGDFFNSQNSGIFRNQLGIVTNNGLIRAENNGFIENFSDGGSPGTSASIINNTSISIETRASLTNRGDIINTASGTISMTGDQLSNIPNSGFSFQNDGTITIQRANTTNSPTPFINAGDGEFINNGNLNLLEGDGENVGILNNTATGIITINSLLQNGEEFDNAILVNQGLITNNNSFENIFGAIYENNGDFTNTGTFSNDENSTLSGINNSHTGAVTNDGILAPGSIDNTVGIYNFDNDFTNQNNASLLIEIDDASTPGIGYDQVTVNGIAQLAGNLTVTLSPNYLPELGDTFTILTANSISGTFDTANFPLSNILTWEIDYQPTSVTLTILVNCNTPVTFTAPDDTCVNTAVQTGISGGLFEGGVYSGPGVTDTGDGITYSFDPMIAGIGIHTLVYTFTNPFDTECVMTASDTIEVFALPEVDFTAPENLPLDAGIQTDLNGGTPAVSILSTTVAIFINYEVGGFPSFIGGNIVFNSSGTMVSTDVTADNDGNGSITNLVDATALDATITLDFGNGSTGTIVADAPIIGASGNLTFSGSNLVIDGDVFDFFSGTGTASTATMGSGIYAGPGVTNEASGTLYSFDPAVAGAGTHTITYTFTDDNGCAVTASDTMEVFVDLCTSTTTYTIAGGWDNGTPNATTRAIINGNYSTAIEGDITACELIINTGAILTVADGNFISVENNITINGTLDVANTGSVVQVDENAITINNGSIAVAKTTPTLDDRNFVAMSSPVTAEARDRVYGNSRAVFSIIPSNFIPFTIDFLEFPEFEFAENFLDDNNDYLLPATGSTATPAAGIGQLIFPQPEPNVGDGAYTLTYTQSPMNPGTLNSGTISVPINYNGPATINNYNLLGNPYASAIDVTAFINANDAVNEVYYWDHITNPTSELPGFGTSNFSMNDISIRNAMMGIAAVNGGTPPGQFMSSGQGFGIKADQAEMVAGTPVVFTNSIRVTGNNDGFRNSETSADIDKLWLNLTTTAFDEAIAQTGIGFTPEATPSIDKGYDSPRVGTFLSLFTRVDSGELLGIQAREAFEADMEIALGFSTSIEAETPYTISIGNLEGIAIENASVFIIDHASDTIVNLSEQPYTFTAQKGLHTDRFTMVFQDREVLNADEESFRESRISLYPNPSQGQVTLAYTGSSTLENAAITDVNGKIIKRIDLSNFNKSQTMDLSALARGMYFMQIISQGNTIVKKLILR
ncbi:hypothetical protein GCM10011344_40770 [Dokdonia pacifica]|uniref:Por secretion system C-terminal sorting domain-containing protein n=1 Tax=Dokdonia pacifica TaxID=1627892 RepID=A0A239A9K9_9FLAO|nr:T9SS type A sorting domain-containing protein [Dokdonia pacifica]GGG35733.1 hypothetical protein GCM10011344_40770 [Dokdonia pacifica]SNR92325.1 Por secretion system C-terminal sorting domain-containing protein [Dokdonia pacifica]